MVEMSVYLRAECARCDYALAVAEGACREFPQISLRIVDMADPEAKIPEVVFATPTYLLNGELWSLGNPAAQEVTARLSRALGAEALSQSAPLTGEPYGLAPPEA